MENSNSEQQFRATSHGPRTTNRSYAPPVAGNARDFHRNSPAQANTQGPEKDQGKPEGLKNFRDLKVWQIAKEIAVIVYKFTRSFPQEELYGLSSQMRRSAISISSNIAEGFNRFYKKDYQRFLMISLGSCGELESQIEVGIGLGYMKHEVLGDLLEKLDHENRMLRKLHYKLGENQPHRGPVTPATNASAPLQY